jgi:Zn-dependent protease with chaperone function
LKARIGRRGGLLLFLWAAAGAAMAQRQTVVRPGFNLFTVEQDIELGRQSAQQVERQLPMLHEPAVERYVADIGRRLAAVAPGAKYPYAFKVANLSDINAFALPGGFMYVDRGLIEAVETEGELAGVMAHEMAHVALRHQTNQVSKAYVARAGAGILGGLLGSGATATGHVMASLGGLGLNALFLKFSRTDEEQADVVGTQILSRAGYNTNEMVNMFAMLKRAGARDPGRLARFLSDHPPTADREARVRSEVALLGSVRTRPPSGNLETARAALRRLPPAPSMEQVAKGAQGQPSSGPVAVPGAANARVEPPSGHWKVFEQRNRFFKIRYPDNWRVLEPPSGYGVTIVPPGGVVDAGGQPNVLYGVIVNHYDPFEGSMDGRSPARSGPARGTTTLEQATNDILALLERSNSYLKLVSGSVRPQTIGGARAISLALAGLSPVTGQEERVNLVTRELKDGHVLYAIFIAPARDAAALSPTFQEMMASLTVNDAGAHT